MDCIPQGSSVHGISHAMILEWVAISFSRGSSQPRDWTCVSCNGRQTLYYWATWEVLREGHIWTWYALGPNSDLKQMVRRHQSLLHWYSSSPAPPQYSTLVLFSQIICVTTLPQHECNSFEEVCYGFQDKSPSGQSYGFSSGHVCMWELDHKESWAPKK